MKEKPVQIYIEYNSRERGYYWGVLQDKKIIWNNKYFLNLDDCKEVVYSNYPEGVIHFKE